MNLKSSARTSTAWLQTILLCLGSITGIAQQKGPRLIVRGDDMGYTHAGNTAIIDCFTKGIETSIEIIVPSPWFPEAVKLLRENPIVDVGVHLALTSEWDNVKWRPISSCPSLRDANGYFYPMVTPNKNYPGQSILENVWTIKDVEQEFRAQIELALKLIPRISHISSHMNCTGMTDEVKALTARLAMEYKINISPELLGVDYVGYNGSHKTSEEKIQSFLSMLEKLDAGKTYLFVDHPGKDCEELRAIHHIGYENVAVDRQGVVDVWTSDKVKSFINKHHVQLISYRDLVSK